MGFFKGSSKSLKINERRSVRDKLTWLREIRAMEGT
jgi:hypothetical protein